MGILEFRTVEHIEHSKAEVKIKELRDHSKNIANNELKRIIAKGKK